MKMFIAALASSIFALGPAAQAAQKPTIVLVHGAFEDKTVWGHVTAKLEGDGYKVVAVDLPGRPSNPMPPDKVSLDLYRDTVVNAINATNGPVVLCGHSFGGIVISAAAEPPKKIKMGSSISVTNSGGCGYGIYRQLTDLGHRCMVVATSMIPREPNVLAIPYW